MFAEYFHLVLCRHSASMTSQNAEHPLDKAPVVLVHGLLHRRSMMTGLGNFLCQNGRKVYYFDYPTSRKTIEEWGELLADMLERTAEKHDKIDLVTHSMGGLLARIALARFSKKGLNRKINRVVMLAPPNHGSRQAAKWLKNFLPSRYLVRPLADLSSTPDAMVHSLPLPLDYEVGVVTARYDTRVYPGSTYLVNAADAITLDAGHAFMMDVPAVRRHTLHFLEHGCFAP